MLNLVLKATLERLELERPSLLDKILNTFSVFTGTRWYNNWNRNWPKTWDRSSDSSQWNKNWPKAWTKTWNRS